jgi:hypothetical protein
MRKSIILGAAAIALTSGLALAGETVTEQRTYEKRSMAVEIPPPPPPPAAQRESNTVEQKTTRKTGDGTVEEHSTYESSRSNVERTAPPPPPTVIEKKTEVIEHDDD